MGLASGPVVVGYVGTPLLFSCSVFGRPVAIANRCTSADLIDLEGMVSSSITFPASEWGDREIGDVLEPVRYKNPDGTTDEKPLAWELLGPAKVPMKGIGDVEICQLVNRMLHMPMTSAEERAKGRDRGSAPARLLPRRTHERALRRRPRSSSADRTVSYRGAIYASRR
jgi:class 3 adenylate cyclase